MLFVTLYHCVDTDVSYTIIFVTLNLGVWCGFIHHSLPSVRWYGCAYCIFVTFIISMYIIKFLLWYECTWLNPFFSMDVHYWIPSLVWMYIVESLLWYGCTLLNSFFGMDVGLHYWIPSLVWMYIITSLVWMYMIKFLRLHLYITRMCVIRYPLSLHASDRVVYIIHYPLSLRLIGMYIIHAYPLSLRLMRIFIFLFVTLYFCV